MTPRWFPILLCTALGCAPRPTTTVVPAPAPTRVEAPAAAPRVIVLVRHGEKQSEDRDAPLSPAGHARAECLADTLADLGVSVVITSEFSRTKDTAAPLAKRLGITPEALPAGDVKVWLDRLRALPPGAVALVAGHSNTVPDLVAGLGAGTISIAGDAYDGMFVVVLPEHGDATLLRTHYCIAKV